MNIGERISLIKAVAEKAIKGKSDEEIAKELNMNATRVTRIRRAVGIKKRWALDITKEYKKARVKSGSIGVNFTIPREHLTELGIDPQALIDEVPHEFTGEIKNKKLALKFREA